MTVTILGNNAGSYLAANTIDTPYTSYDASPYCAGPPWNYGSTFGLSLGFGNAGWARDLL